MKTFDQLDAMEVFELSRSILDALDLLPYTAGDLATPHEHDVVGVSRPYNAFSRFSHQAANEEAERLQRLAKQQSADRLDNFLATNDAAQCLLNLPDVAQLMKSLARKAGGEANDRFADPRARGWLLHCVTLGLAQWLLYTQSATKPTAITSSDWDKAISAVKTLHELENRGLMLHRAFDKDPGWGWLDTLGKRLAAGKAKARKTHSDEFSADRSAAARFTGCMLVEFNAAPLTMVQAFARIIGYSEEAARKQLPRWIERHRMKSLV